MSQKCILLAVALLLAISAAFAQADSLDFPAPQYMLPMYDSYSRNFLNVEAMGRGYTTAALSGGVENAVNNPAALDVKKAAFWMELSIKPPVREINTSNDQMYTSPVPFGLIGLQTKIYKDLQGAISYNMPKSLVYDIFSMEINQGNGEVLRYPAYYLHQFTGTLAYGMGDFKLGLNLQNQLHSFQDITVFNTFDRIDKVFYTFRLQPGILYNRENLHLGAALTLPSSRRMDIKYLEYDVKLPLQITGGAAYQFGNNRLSADLDWEQFSTMSDRFSDRLSFRAGYEKRIRNFTYRAGVMSFPGVYSGAYRLPLYESDGGEQDLWWSNVDRGGIIKDTDQLYATAGFTYYFKGGKLVMGAMRDVLNHVPTTLVSMSLGFNLETLKRRKFPIFDK